MPAELDFDPTQVCQMYEYDSNRDKPQGRAEISFEGNYKSQEQDHDIDSVTTLKYVYYSFAFICDGDFGLIINRNR